MFTNKSSNLSVTFSCTVIAVLLALVIWFMLRLTLWFDVGITQFQAFDVVTASLSGLWLDGWTLAYLISPFLLVSALFPNRWRKRKCVRYLKWIALWLIVATLLFGVLAEFVFWREFSTRFNFIAVDYLIYTHEVIGNIRESYPVPLLLIGIGTVAVLIIWLLQRHIVLKSEPISWKKRFCLLVAAMVFPIMSYYVADIDQADLSGNVYANEIGSNGLFSLAAAMRRNELDYQRFYQTIPQQEADDILASLGVDRISDKRKRPDARKLPAGGVENLGPFKRKPRNIVLISVESFSAKYVGAYGADSKLTPNIDKLASAGLQFDRVLATGTRTVRGLDALSLGTPPIPGQAILRRPENAHLSTIGELLMAQGFATYFIYGGYGYFDNMNSYFRDNHYQVFDRTDFDPATIASENIWGVADESLFANSLNVIEQAVSGDKPFFAHILTTSNHRPYTFPQGRIDLPQGTRESAVKYTDYAIGQFMEMAKAKPWFKDTLFVVVADHCASVAGKTKLPVAKYHIPMIFYAPDMLEPGHYAPMVSQIDLVPTLLDLVADKGDAHYQEADHHFFGQPLFGADKVSERAFISNYQQLGYYKNDMLIVLSPKKKAEAFAIDSKSFEATSAPLNESLLREAIAWYQTSDRAFKTGKFREHVQEK